MVLLSRAAVRSFQMRNPHESETGLRSSSFQKCGALFPVTNAKEVLIKAVFFLLSSGNLTPVHGIFGSPHLPWDPVQRMPALSSQGLHVARPLPSLAQGCVCPVLVWVCREENLGKY